jgi:hypothetical protein
MFRWLKKVWKQSLGPKAADSLLCLLASGLLFSSCTTFGMVKQLDPPLKEELSAYPHLYLEGVSDSTPEGERYVAGFTDGLQQILIARHWFDKVERGTRSTQDSDGLLLVLTLIGNEGGNKTKRLLHMPGGELKLTFNGEIVRLRDSAVINRFEAKADSTRTQGGHSSSERADRLFAKVLDQKDDMANIAMFKISDAILLHLKRHR